MVVIRVWGSFYLFLEVGQISHFRFFQPILSLHEFGQKFPKLLSIAINMPQKLLIPSIHLIFLPNKHIKLFSNMLDKGVLSFLFLSFSLLHFLLETLLFLVQGLQVFWI